MCGTAPAVIGLTAVLATLTLPAHAHPTDHEIREAWEDRQRCESGVARGERVDSARLGMTNAELQVAVEGLQPDPTVAPEISEPLLEKGLRRWIRQASGELQTVEYELWQDRVYRIRWRLGKSFERPMLDEFARHGETCFGRPEFDQTFEAEPGSPAATLRRIGWIHDKRRVEIRQLHPLRGGPVYLTVSDGPILRELGVAGLGPFPEPSKSKPWWQRSTAPLSPVSAEEQHELGQAFLGLLSQLDH